MFENLSHLQLQQYWWIIMSIVGSSLVFLLFVQGGQTLIYALAKNETEKSMVITALGRKWKMTFTTLVMFAAGMFASFPLFYSTSFGGAYYAWKIFLLCFVLQSIAYEFRKQKSNLLGSKTYEFFLYINGFLGTFLLGAVVSTFFTGSNFIRNEYNLSTWQTEFYGIEILFNPINIALGFAVFFLTRVLGALYIANSVDNQIIRDRARKQTGINALLFLVFFLVFFIKVLFIDGFAYNPESYEVFMQSNKYLNNYLEMPMALIMLLAGVVLVLYGIFINYFKRSVKGIWFTGFGTFATVFSIFLIIGFNNTSFYPSAVDLQSSLTIENASASKYTLTIMSYISLVIPIVLAYMFYAWKTIDKFKITNVLDEHSY